MNVRDAGGDEPFVYVIVLNHNGVDDTLECLDSLRDLHYPNRRVVVVDNGSTDGSQNRIRGEHPDVCLLETGRNLGFAEGNNRGIRYALERGARFVWLLNNDTRVEPGALGAMVAEMARGRRVGIVGSVLRPASAPSSIEAWGGGRLNVRLGTTGRRTSSGGRLDHVLGTSMLLRRELLDEVGLLDEAFFFYLEDTDICYRAVRRGWGLAVASGSVVLHKGGATVNRGCPQHRSLHADRLHVRSSGTFIGKHAGAFMLLTAPLRLTGIAIRRTGRGEPLRIPILAREFGRGLRAGLKQREQRRQEWSSSGGRGPRKRPS